MPGANSTAVKCSRAGCTNNATGELIWANPKIHTGDRTKTWLYCDDHLEFLKGYLSDRSFLLEVRARS